MNLIFANEIFYEFTLGEKCMINTDWNIATLIAFCKNLYDRPEENQYRFEHTNDHEKKKKYISTFGQMKYYPQINVNDQN